MHSSARIPAVASLLRFLILAILLAVAATATAAAQTTTIAGKVMDPRTTADALPLPNALVYVTTGKIDPLPDGVQCLTFDAPKNAASFAYTAVDGSFTLEKVPQNATYTLVIQAGKWRRVFTQAVATGAVAGLELHMPADHTQGDIPLIAIATGAVDGVECVLHDMGIANTEFTDDNGKVNPGGRIHLYKGSGNGGAFIDPSTPTENILTGDLKTLNKYDMVMFPCQGWQYVQSSTALTNLVSYANAGGRVFTTHFSYVWLDPDAPLNSPFPAVANWHLQQQDAVDGPATINTSFTDGATLAQWLQNAGASFSNQPGQVMLNTVRHDLDSVIPPTQAWLSMNDITINNAIQQFTFNAPVGAPAAQQCGRVLFNEYHVIAASTSGLVFPAECPGGSPSAQELMLEYALFDLSAFVQPIIIPTLDIMFAPKPLQVRQNDPADQLFIKVTNTSNNTAIDPSAILKITLPSPLTATSLTDSSGGWICTTTPLQCTRNSGLLSGSSDSVTLVVKVGSYAPGTTPSGSIKVTISSPTFSNDVVATDPVVFQQSALLTWANPASIVYGTALGATQLNAAAPIPGTFVYTPPAGTVLPTGKHTLSVQFTPDDKVNYTASSATVTITVVPAIPAIALTATPNPAFIQNPVQFTAEVSSAATAPTGTIVFMEGATPLGSSNIAAGGAAYSTAALGVGMHTISAAYAGDALHSPAVSSNLNLLLEDFKLERAGATAGNDTVTVYPGKTASYTLRIAPVGGPALAGDVALSIAGLPSQASAKISTVVVKANSGITEIQVQVTTSHIAENRSPALPFQTAIPLSFALVLLPFARRIRRLGRPWQTFLLAIAVSCGLIWGITGCGVTYTPKTYNLTITGKAGALSHAIDVKLIVK